MVVSWRTGWKTLVQALFGDQDDGDSTPVTSDTIAGIPAVRHALEKITCHVGQLPLFVYEKTKDGGADKATNHRAYQAMKSRPNPYMGSFDFRELLVGHALLWGDGRAYIDDTGPRTQLWPLYPWVTSTVYIDGKKYHGTKIDSNDPAWRLFDSADGPANTIAIEDETVFHIRGFGFDGLSGRGLLRDAKQTFRFAIDSQTRLDSQMTNGIGGAFILEAPTGAFRKPEDAKQFIDEFNKFHAGSKNAGRVGMLRDGIKANVMSASNSDSQVIENRRFNRQDVALLFGLESILGDDSSVSYNSLEQKMLAYLVNTLMRWVKKIEEEADYKLLTEAERLSDRYYFRFNTSALLRTDAKTQSEIIKSFIESEVLSPNEGRALLDRNPREGGNEYRNPNINTTPPRDGPKETANAKATVQRWITVESETVIRAAETQHNFIRWLDKHYAWWQARLESAMEDMGCDAQIASEHCRQSKEELLSICDVAKQDELLSMVSQAVARWPDRVAKLTERIESCLV